MRVLRSLVGAVTALAFFVQSTGLAYADPPAPPPLPGAAIIVAPQPNPSVFVHLDADDGVALESIAPGSERWAVACTAPCDAQVPTVNAYRVSGEGIRRSRPFELAVSPGLGQHIVIHVSPASKRGFVAGIALLSTGAVALGVGAGVYLDGAVGGCTEVDALGVCDARAPNTHARHAAG
jgi:hypothetical protein